MSTSSLQANCDACNKSTLSLLLVRPSPIAIDPQLAPLGSASVINADSRVAGLVPARKPTQSRYVLRLLREGYVHVYLPSPPPGMKNWRVYRVSANADLRDQDHPDFSRPTDPEPCQSPKHNKAGMKLLSIPQAHKISTLWIAYSANLWSDKLKAQNAANPQVMQQVNLRGGGANTFTPTVEALKTQVLECAVLNYRTQGGQKSPSVTDQDFVFTSMVDQAQGLVDSMQRAAACHPKTQGLEKVVVLRDPVGIATELNALRLRRHELAKLELEKPENAHPLNSSNALLGLQKSLLDINLASSFVQVSPLKTKSAFDRSKEVPPGTQWHPLSDEENLAMNKAASGSNAFEAFLLSPYKRKFEKGDLGRVVYANHDERARAWAAQQVAKTWEPIAKKYNEQARAAWVAQFEARMKTQHYEPLAKFEDDWIGATTDSQLLAYFDKHFDDQDSNDPMKPHRPGVVYARESQYVHAPAPLTLGPVLDTYLGLLDKPITDKAAIVQRALVGNQASVFASLQAYAQALYQSAIGDPGADADQGGGMRDKAYDFMKGLYSESTALNKYSWLGNAIAMFSTHHLAALTSASLSAVARSQTDQPALMRNMGKVQSLWGVHHAIELVVQGALQGDAPKVPLLITMKVDVADALAVLRARQGQDLGVSRSQVKKMRGTGAKLTLSVLTDSEALRVAQGDVKAVLKDATTGTVGMKGAALNAATAGGALALTQDQFLALYARQSQAGSAAAKAVHQTLVQASSDIRSITMSVGGRLAMGSIYVQGLGLANGLTALKNAKDQKAVRDAWYGIYDSSAGAMGGLLEMWAVAVNSRIVAQVGVEAAKRSLPLGALRFAGNIAGAAGGAVNAVAAWNKAADAQAAGNIGVATLYQYSAVSFSGTVGTSVVMAASVGANTLAARGIGGHAARTILLRIGAAGTAQIVGLSVSGWGLVLLGAGVMFQVGATVITPTPMQKWAGRSYFGKGDDKFPPGDWRAEFEGLQKALDDGSDDAAKTDIKPAEEASSSNPASCSKSDMAAL